MIKDKKKDHGTRTWRRGEDKPWRKKHRRVYGAPIELCLCPTCANTFYLMEDHYIKRVDHNQRYKDTCSMCGVRYGYDYKIYDNSKSMNIQYV